MPWGLRTIRWILCQTKITVVGIWGCTDYLDALLNNMRIFSVCFKILRFLTLLWICHDQLTVSFKICRRCWFYGRVMSCSCENEPGERRKKTRDVVGRSRETGCWDEEREQCVLGPWGKKKGWGQDQELLARILRRTHLPHRNMSLPH